MSSAVVGRVLVAGGGLAGLATAIALGRKGIEVRVVERNAGFSSNGSGITLMGPALRVLGDLGLVEACLDRGYGVTELVTATAAGELLETVDLPRLLGPKLPAIAGLYRPELLNVLLEAALATGASLSVGTTVTDFEQTGTAVAVAFSDGTTDRYDLVVGADGWLSPTRGRLLGAAAPAPVFLEQAVWRAVVRRPGDFTRSTFLYGTRRKAGFMPISADRMYAYVVESATERSKPAADAAPEMMREMLADFSALPAEIRESITDPAQVDVRPLHKLVVPSPWSRGRIVLIGDAVHLPTPQLGMGGGMAMEDGYVLADVLTSEKTVEAALSAFTRRRFARCRAIVDNSVQLSEWEKNAAEHGPEAARLMNESQQLIAQPI
ncbi:FAD-dependent monooxygenase [Amycolatopsis sp. NPDC059021]|uniref:FAD-dependent monooxygenase n=1 Tax=Amycolatopsis sp. NPDC059021 TaxID=3346704 RepID=UPI00366E68BA